LFDAVALRDERMLMTSPTTRHVIAVSRLVKDQLMRHYRVPGEKITVIPNGVDLERLASPSDPASRSQARAGMGFSDATFGLLFVGNEYDRKGLQTVLEAIAGADDRSMALAVIGDDDPAPYESLARALGIRSRVRFLGGVGGPEPYFRAADVLVLPVWYEPFGMVVAEAMAAGLPVIATGSTGALEGLRHQEHALFLEDPLDAKELAHALIALRKHPELRRTMSARAQHEANILDWSRVAELTLAVYAKVTGVPPT
jgi:UDP-glucose:(heptosyl)LPS alpha-1,3-glucosyltransferase